MSGSAKLYETPQLPRWYFGGIASMISASILHPLELIKTQMQSQGEKSFFQIIKGIFKEFGCLGLYNGLSCVWVGQFLYASTRFSIFYYIKRTFPNLNFPLRALIGAFSGFCGAMVGNPIEVVRTNMQNDSKRPPEQRKNYANVFNGVLRTVSEEGFKKLYMGVTFGGTRAAILTIGQLTMYDQMKQIFLNTGIDLFKDAVLNHFISSFIAGVVSVTITQPVDVLKTRIMTAEIGTYTSLWNCFVKTAKEGILAFYKGVFLSGLRTMFMTVITFLLFEQFRQHLGFLPSEEVSIHTTDAASNLTAASSE